MALTFSPEQMADASEWRFERRLMGVIAESDPTALEVLGTPEGLAMLRKQCSKARQYGMSAEMDIARYGVSAWLMGPDFDTRFPAIAEVLGAERLSASQKAEAIERICTAVLLELDQGKA